MLAFGPGLAPFCFCSWVRPPFRRRTASNCAALRPSRASSIRRPLARALHRSCEGDQHPRCVNCHPASDRPTQGDDMHPHSPSAARGIDGGGVPGNSCSACHSIATSTFSPVSRLRSGAFQAIPAGTWRRKRWRGKENPSARSAGKSKTRSATAGAVSNCCTSIWRTTIWSQWGWSPGSGRDPVPGTQEVLASSFALGSIAGLNALRLSIYTAAARGIFFAAPRGGTGRSRARANVRTISRSTRRQQLSICVGELLNDRQRR